MNKFLFKSSEPDLSKMYFKIVTIQDELRAQRIDMAVVKRQLTRLINDINLQTEVDSYYDSKDTPEHEDKEPD